MIIELSRLKPGGETLEGEEPVDILELEPDCGFEVLTPIRYRLLAELLPGELVVRGRLSCRASFDCGRCAIRFEKEVVAPDFLVVKPYHDVAEAIDLTPEVREDMILAFPNYPVCSPGCRGLCPRCGANWNEKACSCRPPGGEGAWSALDELKKRME